MCVMKEFRGRAETKLRLPSVAEVMSDAENHLLAKSLVNINWPLAPLKPTDVVTSGAISCRTSPLSLHTAWPQVHTVPTDRFMQPQVSLQLHFALWAPTDITAGTQQNAVCLHCRHASTLRLFPK